MAVAFRSSTTYNSGASSVSSFIINTPAGIQQNDFMFAFMTVTGGTGTTVTPPAGWTAANASNSTTVYGTRVFTKVATASEPASFTFTISGAVNVAATLQLLTGMQFGNPFNGLSGIFSTGATTSTSISNIPTNLPAFSMKTVAGFRAATGGATISSAGAGYTVYSDTTNSGAASNFVQAGVMGGLVANTADNITPTATTLSASMDSNFAEYFFVEEDKTAATFAAIDYINSGGTIGATSFVISNKQSMPNQLAYILVLIPGSSVSVTSITASGITWSRVGAASSSGNITVEVWSAILTTGIASFIISTVNLSGSSAANAFCLTMAGSAIGGPATTANAATGTASTTLTTTKKNSWVYSIIGYSGAVSTTASAGSEILKSLLGASTTANLVRRTAVTANSGTSVTISTSAPTTTPWAMVEFEIFAAIKNGDFFKML